MAITKFAMRRPAWPLLVAGAALVLGAASYGGVRYWQASQQVEATGLADLGLVTSNGAPFDAAQLLGRPTAVFFGFTHCPDVCPMTLQRLALMRQKIGPAFDQLQVLFITLDPDRDTRLVLGDYMSAQPIAVTGLTGPHSAVDAAAHNFGIFRERIAIPGQGYTIDHTASLFLLDREGRRTSEIGIDASEVEFEDKLRSVLSLAPLGDLERVERPDS